MNTHFSNYIDAVAMFSEIDCFTLDADEFDQKFSIYPNPASTVLNIETTQNLALNTIEIFNLKGQLVFQKTISDQLNTTTLELSSFQKGIYILKLSDVHGKALIEKLIIQD